MLQYYQSQHTILPNIDLIEYNLNVLILKTLPCANTDLREQGKDMEIMEQLRLLRQRISQESRSSEAIEDIFLSIEHNPKQLHSYLKTLRKLFIDFDVTLFCQTISSNLKNLNNLNNLTNLNIDHI